MEYAVSWFLVNYRKCLISSLEKISMSRQLSSFYGYVGFLPFCFVLFLNAWRSLKSSCTSWVLFCDWSYVKFLTSCDDILIRTWRHSYTTLRSIPNRCSTMLQGYKFHYVHRTIICDIQTLEKTYTLSHNRRMDTQNVVHLLNGLILSS